MRAAVFAAVLAGVLAAATMGRRELSSTPRVVPVTSASSSSRAAPSECPPGTLPDRGVCIPAPNPGRSARPLDAARIHRFPDRAPEFSRYVLPASGTVTDARRNFERDGGVLLTGTFVDAPAGTPVTDVALRDQSGDALVVYAGPLVGATLVTLHATRINERPEGYLVIIGNLVTAPAYAPHAKLSPDTVVGKSGTTPLYLETRLVRPDTDVFALTPKQLLDEATTVSVDLRNVFRVR